MSREVALAAVKLSATKQTKSGLLFYGGEPLLERQLIFDVIGYAREITAKTGHSFYYKMTTNGVLLDEEFLKFSAKNSLTIGFSHDGLAQDDCRLFPNGDGSFELLEKKIPMLLEYQPYAVAMSVIDPSTVGRAAETVEFLISKGFKYITVGMNYCKTAAWTEEKLAVLEGEYKKIAKMYVDLTKAEEKIYISPIDMKILSHIKGEKYHTDRSDMAVNQPSVAPDGKIYSASKHLGNPAFEVGDVFRGVDRAKQKKLSKHGKELYEPCKKCAIKSRCNYAYDNLKYEGSRYSSDVSPVQCANERVITPIADHAAETLYNEQNALFIHRHYNDMFPLVSLVEDRANDRSKK